MAVDFFTEQVLGLRCPSETLFPIYARNSVNAYQKLNSLGSQLHRITVNRSKGKTTSFLADLAERCPDPISLPDFDRLRTIGFS